MPPLEKSKGEVMPPLEKSKGGGMPPLGFAKVEQLDLKGGLCPPVGGAL